MSTPESGSEYLRFQLIDNPLTLYVVQCEGLEELSQCFNYRVELLCPHEYFEAGEVLESSARLSLKGKNGGGVRYVHGCVVAVNYLGPVLADSEYHAKGNLQQKFFHRYEFILEPLLAGLAKNHRSRIFQDMTTLEILQSVLRNSGIAVNYLQTRLIRGSPMRSYCVQFEESDLCFVQRLLQEEGLVYFFQHEKFSHTWIVSDHQEAYPKHASKLEFKPTSGLVTAADCVFEMKANAQLGSKQVNAHAFQFSCPNAPIFAQYPGDACQLGYSLNSTFSLDHTKLEEKVKLHWAAMLAEQEQIHIRSDSRELSAGMRVAVTQHPVVDFNQEYLVTALRMWGKQPAVGKQYGMRHAAEFSVQLRCVRASRRYLPAVKPSGSPRIGAQTAIVVGPENGKVHTDKYGRVKVRFHWDRMNKDSGGQSCWLRVAQISAGNAWGSIFLPRVGQEVVVMFLGGNPEYPIVSGCLYNGDNLPPFSLPENRTRSVIRGQTQGDAANQLLMEDKPKSSQLELSNIYGHRISMDEASQSLRLSTKDEHQVVLDDKKKYIEVRSSGGHCIAITDVSTENPNSAASAKQKSQSEDSIRIQSSAGYLCNLDDAKKELRLATTNGHQLLLQDSDEVLELLSAGGHLLNLSDKDARVQLKTASGIQLLLDDQASQATLADSSGENLLNLSFNDKKITIHSQSGSIFLEAPHGDIAIKAKNLKVELEQDFIVEAGGKYTAGTAEFELKSEKILTQASADCVIKGMPVKIN